MENKEKEKEANGHDIHNFLEDKGSVVRSQQPDAIGVDEVNIIPTTDTEPTEVAFGVNQTSNGVGFAVCACSGEVDSSDLRQHLSSIGGDGNSLSHPPGFTPKNSEEESQYSFFKLFSRDALESEWVDLPRFFNVSDNHIAERNETFELGQILGFSMEGLNKTGVYNGHP